MGKLYLMLAAVAVIGAGLFAIEHQRTERYIEEVHVETAAMSLAREAALAGMARAFYEARELERSGINAVDDLVSRIPANAPLTGRHMDANYSAWLKRASPTSYRIISVGRYNETVVRDSTDVLMLNVNAVQTATRRVWVRFRGEYSNSCLAVFMVTYKLRNPNADPDKPNSWIPRDTVLLAPLTAFFAYLPKIEQMLREAGIDPQSATGSELMAIADTMTFGRDEWIARDMEYTLTPGDRFNIILAHDGGRCGGWYSWEGMLYRFWSNLKNSLAASGCGPGCAAYDVAAGIVASIEADGDTGLDPWDWRLDMFPDHFPAFQEPVTESNLPAWRETEYALILPHPNDPGRFLIGFNDESDSYTRKRRYCYVDGVRDLSYKCSNAYRNAHPGHTYQLGRPNDTYDYSAMIADVKANGYGDTEWKLRANGQYSFGGNGWYDPSWYRDPTGFPALIPWDLIGLFRRWDYFDPFTGLIAICGGNNPPPAWAPSYCRDWRPLPARLEEVRWLPDFLDGAIEFRITPPSS